MDEGRGVFTDVMYIKRVSPTNQADWVLIKYGRQTSPASSPDGQAQGGLSKK